MGDAALGTGISELLKVVVVVAKKTLNFKSNLKALEKTLETVEIKKLHKVLNRPKQETQHFLEKLTRGLNLVQKCSEINSWNVPNTYLHSRKLVDLDKSIVNFFHLDLALDRNSAKLDQILEYLIDYGSIENTTKNVIRDDLNKFKLDLILKLSINEFSSLGGVPNGVVGFDQPLKELKEMLLRDEVRIKVISAPGGCGKTTLAKMLCHDPDIKGRFKDNILFVTISKSANITDIVKIIIQQLLNSQVPDIQNDDDAINYLACLLKFTSPSPILLVLDDVWYNEVSLVDSLLSLNLPNYKILVTSRYSFPQFEPVYSLKILNNQDAMTLFRQYALPDDRSSTIPYDLVKKIVKGCKGFPLVLKVAGRSLYGKEEVIWRREQKKWYDDGKSIINTSEEVCDRLQPSIDALEEMKESSLKDCCLDLGSFPEDQKVSATTLMDIWAELYNLDDMDTYTNLVELAFRNLANLSRTRQTGNEVGGFCNEMYVMQHDLLRDLAIRLSNTELIEHRKRLYIEIKENNFPKWWTEEISQPILARLVSISTDKNFYGSWLPLILPAAEVVILNCSSCVYIIPEFIERMKQLKVLVVTNYGSFSSELINFQLLRSLPHLRRMKLERVSISSLNTSLLELVNLQKITFTMCKIGKAFEDGNIDLSHVFPDLVEIEIDCCDDLLNLHVSLCDIGSLKKISITNCNELSALPAEIGRLGNLESLMLNSCTKLLELPESVGDLHKLTVLDISDCSNIKNLPKRVGEALKTIHVRGCQVLLELHKLPSSLKDLRF